MKKSALSFVLIILLILTLTCVLFACTADPDSDSGSSGTPSGTTFDDLDTVDSVSRITVTALKDTYYLGEAIDRSQYVVKVILTDGSFKTISMTHPSVKIEDYDPYTVGETTFTVRYGQATYSCTVNIVAPDLESIAVITPPEKTTYVEGDDLNLKGATLRLTLVTGQQLTIDLNAGFVSGYRKDLVGEQTVIVDYAGKTTSFNVTVLKKTLSSVRLDSAPDKKEYLTGDELIKDGTALKLIYDNGDATVYSISELNDYSAEYNAFLETYDSEEASSEEAFSATLEESGCFFLYDFTLPDNNTPVRLYYVDVDGDAHTLYSTTFYCSVAIKLPRENQAVEIKSIPDQLREDSSSPLIEGGVIDYTGGSITVYYQDGSSQDFDMTDPLFTKTVYTSDGAYTVTDTSSAGTYILRFSYYRNDSRGWYADMTFTVRKKTPVAVRFVNTDGLYAADYYIGTDRELNYNDLKYVIDYNNGTSSQPIAVEKDVLTDGTDFSTLTVDGDYITDTDGRRYKNKSVKIAPLPDYPSVTTELTVAVYEHLITSLTVISAPNNVFLSASATTIRELSGLALRARYNSGYEKTILASDVTPIFEGGATNPSEYINLADDVADGTAELAAYIEHPDTTTETVAGLYTLTLTVKETCSTDIVLPTYKLCFTSLQPSAAVSVLTRPSLAYIKGDKITLLGQRFEIDLGGNHTFEITGESDVSDTVTFTSDDLNKVVLKKSLYLSETFAVATGKLNYNFFGTTFSDDIIVTPIRLSGLEVTSNGNAKINYSLGEPFSTPDGIVVTVIKNNGARLSYTPTFMRVNSASDVTVGGFYFSISDNAVEGSNTVYLYYREGTQTVSATWHVYYADDSLILKGVELYRGDNKYDNASDLYEAAAGLNLNLGEFTLRLEYSLSNGSSVYRALPLVSEMIDYDFADNTLGERIVRIHYADYSIDWKINVVPAILSGITLDVSDMRLDYVVGQNLDYSGGYVVRHYGAALPSDRVSMAYAKVVGFDSDVDFEEGITYVDRTVYVDYGGYSANFTVRIWNRLQPSIRFINIRQRVDDTFKDETTFEFIRVSDSFADPSYRIYFDFADAYGNWISISANGAYYEYAIDGIRYEYYSADLLPHHVGTYRIRVVCAENDYYQAATFTSEYYIERTTVTLRVNSATISYGDSLPELTFVPTVADAWNYVIEKLGVPYSGSPAPDGVTDVSTLAVGKYEDLLGIGTLSHPYFYISVEKGTLVVNPRTIVVKVDNASSLRYDDGIDLYDRIELSVSYGDFSISGTIEELKGYFTVENATLSDVGVYTLALTSTTVDGAESYVLTDQDGEIIDSITIEVKKALRVLEVTTDNVSVVKNADGSHTLTIIGFDSYPDADKIEWVIGTTGGNWRSVTDPSTTSITLTFSDSDTFVYLYFRYSYDADDTYESTNAVPLLVDLVK